MKLNMYSIYDTVAAIFHKPFTEVNHASAVRAFDNSLIDNPNTTDYVLYFVATMEDTSGVISSVTPEKIRTGFETISISSTTSEQKLNDLEIFKKQSGDR